MENKFNVCTMCLILELQLLALFSKSGMQGAYFYMGAHKCDVFVVIKIGACIHGAYFVWVPNIPDR